MEKETIFEVNGRDFIRLECLVDEHSRNLALLKEQWDEYENSRKEEFREFYRRFGKIENLQNWLEAEIKTHKILHNEMRTQEGLEIMKIKEKLIFYAGVVGMVVAIVTTVLASIVIKKLF